MAGPTAIELRLAAFLPFFSAVALVSLFAITRGRPLNILLLRLLLFRPSLNVQSEPYLQQQCALRSSVSPRWPWWTFYWTTYVIIVLTARTLIIIIIILVIKAASPSVDDIQSDDNCFRRLLNSSRRPFDNFCYVWVSAFERDIFVRWSSVCNFLYLSNWDS